MRPDQGDLDDENRGHMALNLKERIERGENPEAARHVASMRLPGALPLLGAAAVLMGAAVAASLMPAARASRVDVVQALRSE